MKSSPPPGLPTWLFILTDLALLGTAAVVAWASPLPLSTGALIAVMGCVLLGVLVGLVPLVLRLERAKNAALDERQRALEALAETVRESAQQVSIATGSLHGIAELARRSLREAEQLPERLQERVSALQGQLAEADESARAGLEEELAALRGSELGRIETAVAQIARTATELARLEAAAAKQVAALQREAADSATRLQQALAAAREENGAALETRLREARASLAATVEEATKARLAALDERIARLASLPLSGTAAPAEPRPAEIAASEPPLASPRKPRRPRREEAPASAPEEAAPPAAPEAAAASVEAPASPAPATVAEAIPALAPEAAAEPVPAPPEPISTPPAAPPEPDPVPNVAEPMAHAEPPAEPVPVVAAVEPPPPAEPSPASPAPAPEPPPPLAPRKRPARRVEPEPTLELGFEESPQAAPGVIERTLTSDGATRLLVTAYIGIGNRLFIRGDGPGLSWERGVPLQFISIGKWRWETGEAGAPIRFRIYKNDELECSALGEQVLDPGYLQEVTAPF